MPMQPSLRMPGTNRKPTLSEIVTEADVNALNAALDQHELGPERIAAIHFVPGTRIGNGPGSQYRVLYWA